MPLAEHVGAHYCTQTHTLNTSYTPFPFAIQAHHLQGRDLMDGTASFAEEHTSKHPKTGKGLVKVMYEIKWERKGHGTQLMDVSCADIDITRRAPLPSECQYNTRTAYTKAHHHAPTHSIHHALLRRRTPR